MTGARDQARVGKPVVVEIDVETLGGYFVEEESGQRYINYHAGNAKLSTDNLVISNNSSDPIFVNQSLFTQSIN